MNISQIPVPEVYKQESSDFRFFMKWFELALSKIQYDTEEFFDLFDPLRCPEDLLWMLGDTMGYKYDSRMIPAFNRLVILYFMSMIRLKGSKDGLTLAAQVNLDQFHLKDLASEKDIRNNRLEDTSIPSNSIFVQPHVEEGYIDLVYFSDTLPIDVCTEYVRPVGMYLVPHVGVRYDAKTKISIDSRLTNTADLNVSISPTHVGHYSLDSKLPSGVWLEEDYSRMQKVSEEDLEGAYLKDTESMSREQRESGYTPEHLSDTRKPVWYRNSKYEGSADESINPGYRALYSLQLSNGESSSRSLLHNLSNLSNITPKDVSVYDADSGEVYNNDYYESQVNKVRDTKDPLEYVTSTPMGSLGDSMQIPSEDDI